MPRILPGSRTDPLAHDLDARLARALRPIGFVLGILYLTTVVQHALDPQLQASTPPTAIIPALGFLVLGALFLVRPLPARLANPVLLLAIGFMTVETLGRGQAAAGSNLHWALIALGAVALRPRWARGAAASVIVPWALAAGLGLNGWALDDWAFTLDMVTATALGTVIFYARRRDVLEALGAEHELLESRSGYRRLMAVLQDGVVRLDGAGRILRMNPRAEAILGVTEREAAGLTSASGPWSYLSPDGSRVDPAAMPSAEVLRTGHPVGSVLVGLRRADGSVTWVTENAAPGKLTDDGRPDEVVVSLTDVSPLRDALESASRSEARVREVIDAAGDLILLVDPDGRIVLANPAVARATGFRPKAILGVSAIEAVDPADRDIARELLASVATDPGEDGPVHALRVRRRDGGVLWLEVRAHRLADGTIELIGRDVTMRQALEAERDLLEARLAQAARLEAIGQLAGGVAHDFNNLLTAVMGHTELALEQAHDRPGLLADLGEIGRAAERAQVLTRQLLAFGRRSMLRPRPVGLADVALGLEPMLRRLIGEDVRLSVVTDDDPGPVVVDPGLLEHSLVNLVVNARDAMPDGGSIQVVIGVPGTADELPDGRWAAIRVQDTGRGIPPDVVDRIFEPFFTTKPAGQGTGLGLAMVHGFVDQSGGHLRVSTGPEGGACFSIFLPLADAAAQVATDPAPAAPAASDPEPGAAWPPTAQGMAGGDDSATILVAEDEAVLRAIAERSLQLAGYRVLLADSGEAAIRLAAEFPGTIDLLFTDIVMPGINGLALASTLRADRDGLRVLVTSGYTEDDVVRRGARLQDLPFLAKPYTPSTLAAAVADALA